MNKSILFVINPISGGNDKKSLISEIESWAEGLKIEIELWETTGKNDKTLLGKRIDELSPKIVIALGGDGTLTLCAEVVKNTDIKLGIIAEGSANGMAAELEIPGNLKDALEIIRKEKIVKADMILFNKDKYGLHISDIGVNAKLVKHFEESERRGFLGYAGGVISELINLEDFEVTIKTDKEEVHENCYMVAFANAKRYGTGALLNNQGKIDDGLMEICILREFDFAGIAGQFWDLIDDDSAYLEVIQCREAHITVNGDIPFQIDGELQENTHEIHVQVIPSCLNIIIP